MKLKKIIAVVLILILGIIVLSGCSSNSSSEEKNGYDVLEIKAVDQNLNNKIAIPESGEINQKFEAKIYDEQGELLPAQEIIWLEIETEGISIEDGILKVTAAAAPGKITITAISAADSELSNQIEIELFRAVSSLSGKVVVDFNSDSILQSVSSAAKNPALNLSALDLTSREDSGQKIISFKKDLSSQEKEKILKEHGADLIKYINNGNSAVVKIEQSPLNAVAGLERLEQVNYVEVDQKVWITGGLIPNDPEYSSQWNLPMLDFPFLWENRISGEMVVAVLDTGIASSHLDLKGNVLPGYNFYADSNNTEDDNGHGTHVAGIIGARTDNGIGVAGSGWDIKLLPVKVLGSSGGGSISTIAEGIRYAAGLTENPQNPNPADVINLSLGTRNYSAELEAAVQEAVAAGKVVVASAGNYGETSLLYPARLEETIAVGAVNSQFKTAAYSHSGSMLDVLAPGGDDEAGILSTVLNGGYGYMAGTSMAAPHVSALAALMLERGIRASEIKSVLHQSSIHPGEDKFSQEYGYGIVNANFAYNNLQELKIVVGNREGDQINTAAEGRITLAGGNYELQGFPIGEYSVFAWIDVDNDSIIDEEDYLTESEVIDFESQKDYQQNLELIIN